MKEYNKIHIKGHVGMQYFFIDRLGVYIELSHYKNAGIIINFN